MPSLITQGIDTQAPLRPYTVTIFAEGTAAPFDAAFDPNSNGTLMLFNNGEWITGSYDLSNGFYQFFTSYGYGSNYDIRLDVYWFPTSTEVIRNNATTATHVYQDRPEDQMRTDTQFETADEYPFRRDVVGGGELIEITGHAVPYVPDVAVDKVAQTVAVKDHTGVDYTVMGVNSTVNPIRLTVEVNPTDSTYILGQTPIAYKGNFNSLPQQSLPAIDLIPGFFTDLNLYMQAGFALYHTGLVQGILVADPRKFFTKHHRDNLVAWLPFSEHPDEGAVVNDRSGVDSVQVLNGFTLQESFSSRKFDSRRGWYLRMENGASVSSETFRNISDAYSASLWIRADAPSVTTGTNTIFSNGPLSVDLVDNTNAAYVYAIAESGTRELAGSVTLTPGTFQQLAFTLQGPYVGFGAATLDTTLVMNTGTLDSSFETFPDFGTNTSLIFQVGTNRGYDLSDFRAWSSVKTQADLDLVRYHQPTPTVCTYWPTNIEVAGSRDRYGLKVLDSGYVYPDKMPPAIRVNQLARVRRYNDEGRFEGENRYNETGFGGGMPLPPTYLLGQQFFDIASTGTTVFSTTTGQVPGFNQAWAAALPSTGTNQFFSIAGSTATGLTGTNQLVTTSFWPAIMEFTNPIQEQIWVQGVGGVYEVTLVGVGDTQAALSGTIVARLRSDAELILTGNGTNGPFKRAEQPTGAETVFELNGTNVYMLPNGTAFQSPGVNVVPAGAVFTTHFYTINLIAGHRYRWIKGNNETGTGVNGPQNLNNSGPPGSILDFVCSFVPALVVFSAGPDGTPVDLIMLDITTPQVSFTTPPVYMYLNQRTMDNVPYAWTRWTDNVDPNLFGNQQTPPVAALNANDILEFENTSTLSVGRYRLTIVSGNIGQVDADFEGFNVAITLDSVQINAKLAAGQTGANFQATDVFEFELDIPINPNWLMTIQWFNASSDPTRGTARQMAILGYKLEKLATSVYKVTINSSGTTPLVSPIDVTNYVPTAPGGWLAVLNSYGTVCRVVHESLIYPSNDTVASTVPMSSLFTSNTWAKREDHYLLSGTNVIIADPVHPALPGYSGITIHGAGFLIDPMGNFIVDPIDGGRIISP